MKKLFTLITIISLLLTSESLFSQNTWDGSASVSWTNAANWSLNHVPTSAENVIIPSAPANQPLLSGFTGVCNNLTVNAGATLTISGTTLSSGVLTASGTATINGTLSIGGGTSTTGRLNVTNITWASGSAMSGYYNGRIEVSGNWEFSTGSAVSMGYCSVYFLGSSHGNIISKSASSSFTTIYNSKNAGYYVYLSATSTSTLKITGSLVLNAGTKLYGEAAITTILQGSLLNSGNFYFNSGTVSMEQTSGTQNIQVNSGDYFNSLKINGGATVTLNNPLFVNADLTIQSGTFDPANNTVNVTGDWINTAGPDHFIEGAGRVVFLVIINKDGSQGVYDNLCNYSENFNILEVNNNYGYFVVNNASATVTCSQYDYTLGGVNVLAGTFTALDLVDNAIYGYFGLQTGGTINLTNTGSFVDLSGYLNITGGTFNVYGGTDQSYWPYNNNGGITMSNGTLNFADQGIRVHGSLSLTSNITGGTIKTSKGFSNNRTDFNPTGGTVELYSSADGDLYCISGGSLNAVKINKSISDGGTFLKNPEPTVSRETGEVVTDVTTSSTVTLTSNITINGLLTVENGLLKATNRVLTTGNNININSGGTLWLESGSQLKVTGGKILTVNTGGLLKVIGIAGTNSVITRVGTTSQHEFQINGTLSARYALFEYNYGVNIWSTGTIDPDNPLDYCTFQNGVDRFLLISNSQTVLIRGANFPTAPLYNNVYKNNDAGTVTFKDATGLYAGTVYELDPYNRVFWVASQPGLWKGLVSNDWHNAGNWDDLNVPGSATNVTIPTGAPNYPVVLSGTANCNNLTITGTLTISNAILQVAGNVAVNGTLAMNNAAGQLIVQGDVSWNSGSLASITSNSVIHVYGHWNFNAGANALLGNGSVYFKGSSNKYIRSYSANCSFWNLLTNKTGSFAVEFYDASTQPLSVNGSFTTIINSKFISASSQAINVKGNIVGNGIFQCSAGRVNLNGASQTITPNSNDYFNNLEFNQSGTVTIVNTYTNILNIKGGVTINSGVFNAGSNIINVGGGWSNMPGTDAFVEGTSRVVFNGPGVQTLYQGEDFNVLEVNKTTGLFVVNGPVVTCAAYDWTAGSILAANLGVFTANDLVDAGLFGGLRVQSGGVINLHQDVLQYVDLGADLSIEGGGSINVFGGNGWSQWPFGANASIYMVDGTLDFKNQGINVNTMAPYTFSTNITGGTIRTTGGFFCNRSDFAPADGTLELYGTNDANLEVYAGSMKNLKINKALSASPLSNTVNLLSNINLKGLTIESGTLKVTNKVISAADHINVNNGGTLWLENATQLLVMGEKALTVHEGGFLKVLGVPGSEPIITRFSFTPNYELHINGTISARHAIFDYNSGLDISVTGIVDPLYPLDHCTFQHSMSSAMYIDNAQDLVIRNAHFPSVITGKNVSKIMNSGHVTFKDATGAYAGAAHEYDPYNRIDWSASQPGLWTGLVSTDWHTAGNWDDLLVPTASTNVTIPTGVPNMPFVTGATAYCNSLTLEGTLTVQTNTMQVAGSANISGALVLNNLGWMNIQGDMNWNAGSTASVSINTNIYVYGNWTFNSGSNAQLTSGNVEFKGAVSKKIFIYSTNCSFNDVHIDKTGGASMTYDYASTGPMKTKGLFVRINSYFISNSLLHHILVTGNVYSFGRMELNATVIEFIGTDHILLPNVNDYYGGFMFKQSGTVTINQSNTNTVDIRGGIYIYTGIFSPENSILKIQNRWENNSGSPAFAEGTSRVIFTGTTPVYCSTEQFYIVEIDKSSTYFYVNYNSTVTCQIFDWTQGGMWIYNNGNFEAADLADDGIFGTFVLEGNSVELHQDAAQRVDLCGSITINAGQFKVYGGVDNSQWGFTANASLTMTNGVLDFVDQAIAIQNVAPYSFISIITGGTIRNQKGIVVQSPGFNPAGGLMEIYGNQNAVLLSEIGGAFYNVTINKLDVSTRVHVQSSIIKNNLIVDEGLAEVGFGKVLQCRGNITANQGGWLAVTSGTIKLANLSAININNGAVLTSEGYEGSPSVFSGIEPSSYYAFNVNSGGDFTVYHTIFENMNEQGINILSGGIINPWQPFKNCEFRNGKSGAFPLLSINNNQVLAIENAIFPANTWMGTYNVSKNINAGHVVFYNATGAFAGAAFENDPNGLIDWTTSLTVTAIATPQSICVGSSAQLDVVRDGGLAPFTYLWSPASGLSDPAIINPMASPTITTAYAVTVTDAIGQVAVSDVILTVNPLLPVSVNIATFYNPAPPGSFINFTATPINGGDEPSYQWKVNGVDVGADLPTYSYYPLNGDEVTCVLTSNAPCTTGNPATSNTITMIMVPAYINVSGEILSGTDTCLNATGTITAPLAPDTFTVYPGGSATLIAGARIRIMPGATVQAGGYLHAYITETNEYCGSIPPPMVAVLTGEAGQPSVQMRDLFSIYPNPGNGKFTLLQKTGSRAGAVAVEVFTIRGEQVYQALLTDAVQHELNLLNLSTGLYVLKVMKEDHVGTFKLIINR